MKNLLLITLFIAGLISCTSNDEISSSDENVLNPDIQNLYYKYKTSAQEGIAMTMNALDAPKSRAVSYPKFSGSALVEYLANLSTEKMDSLYNQYCTPEEVLKYDNCTDSLINILIDNSSLDEVQSLFNFTNSYIENGGHNMTMLTTAVSNVSPLIRNCMISCAANIDEFITAFPQSRASNSWCLHQLTIKMAQSSIVSGVTDAAADVALGMIGVPGADVVVALITAGYDLYSAIEMAHEYHVCCATHVS